MGSLVGIVVVICSVGEVDGAVVGLDDGTSAYVGFGVGNGMGETLGYIVGARVGVGAAISLGATVGDVVRDKEFVVGMEVPEDVSLMY
jgi:hypothetical protein